MKQTYRAYVSWLRMNKGDFLFRSGGKLAALWFDEIILPVPRKDLIFPVTEKVAGEQDWDTATLEEVRRLWVPVDKYLSNYRFLSTPWQSSYPDLVEIAQRVTIEETKREFPEVPEDHPGFIHEFAWAGAALIDSVNLWLTLNTQNYCSFLPESREHMVLQEIFSAATSMTPFDIFSEIIIHRTPDLSTYSWNDVIELRHHPFFDAFRKKMVELHKRLDSEESRPVQELVNEISHKDMEEMIRLFRPSPRKSLMKAIASNIPMPIPINPISIVFDGTNVKKEVEISKKYGWLYFLFDLPGSD